MFMFEALYQAYKLLRRARNGNLELLDSKEANDTMHQIEDVLRKHGTDPDNIPETTELSSFLGEP